eukprot:1153835-Pelagomonas_calceolata.AAC.6
MSPTWPGMLVHPKIGQIRLTSRSAGKSLINTCRNKGVHTSKPVLYVPCSPNPSWGCGTICLPQLKKIPGGPRVDREGEDIISYAAVPACEGSLAGAKANPLPTRPRLSYKVL